MAKKKAKTAKRGRAKALRSIADLRPAPYNPRKISKKAAAGLGASIEKFGDVSGIVWNKRSGHLVAGHRRLEQLQKAGAKLVGGAVVAQGKTFPVRIVDWDARTEKAANIAANNPHIAGEFDDGLGELLDELLQDMGEDAFGELNFDTLKEGLASSLDVTQDDVPAPPKRAVTKTGDVWELGRHRMVCGDASSKPVVDRALGKLESVDLLLTDPPYGNLKIFNKKGAIGNFGDNVAKVKQYGAYANEGTFELQPVMEALGGRAKHQVIWGGNYFPSLAVRSSWLCWDKRAGKNSWYSDFELAWTDLPINARMIQHTWQGMIRKGESDPRVHPTQKPVALIAWILEELAPSASTVLDLFLGSGTTLVATEQLDRICCGVEIDPRYCDVIVERWQNLTGKKAKRGRA